MIICSHRCGSDKLQNGQQSIRKGLPANPKSFTRRVRSYSQSHEEVWHDKLRNIDPMENQQN